MHEETDRLSYLRNDWRNEYPLVDLKVLNSADYSLKPVAGILRQYTLCEETFGPGYFMMVPARWEGMAMGCNCTD